jgi:hypothetical protein
MNAIMQSAVNQTKNKSVPICVHLWTPSLLSVPSVTSVFPCRYDL